jgi:hypothetical protein
MAAAPKKVDWRTSFKARFPQFASLVDGGAGEAEARRLFGNELVDIILDVAQNPGQYDFTTQAGIDAFDIKVRATPYYQQTANSAKEFDSLSVGEQTQRVANNRALIAANYGDLNLTVSELDAIARAATRTGMTGIVLTNYINSTIGGRARGKQDLLQGLDAQALKKITRAYNYNPTDLDDQIISAVTGKEYAPTGTVLTADSIRQNAQRAAKSTFFHLSEQIDSGLTLDDIFSPYREIAAKVLEKTPNQISLSDPLFASALGNKKDGQMSLSDWETKLMTDRKYGYEYTAKANQDATNLALTIARAFGRRR